MTRPSECAHRRLERIPAPDTVPSFTRREQNVPRMRPHNGGMVVFRCLDCDLRGELAFDGWLRMGSGLTGP